MSHIGKLSRGIAYYEQRTLDGLPQGIVGDPNKMGDVDYLLDHCKSKKVDIRKVAEALALLKRLDQAIFPIKQRGLIRQQALDIIEGRTKTAKVPSFEDMERETKAEVTQA